MSPWRQHHDLHPPTGMQSAEALCSGPAHWASECFFETRVFLVTAPPPFSYCTFFLPGFVLNLSVSEPEIDPGTGCTSTVPIEPGGHGPPRAGSERMGIYNETKGTLCDREQAM